MNILLVRSGTAIDFTRANDVSMSRRLYAALANEYPQHSFYIAHPCKVDASYKIPGNLHIIKTPHTKQVWDYKRDVLENIKKACPRYDLAIYHLSSHPCGTCNRDNSYASVSKMVNPAPYAILELGLPYITICDDCNGLSKAAPWLLHAPVAFLTQGEFELPFNAFDDAAGAKRYVEEHQCYIEEVHKNFSHSTASYKTKYVNCERWFLTQIPRTDFREFEKSGIALYARLNEDRVKRYEKFFGPGTPFDNRYPIYTQAKVRIKTSLSTVPRCMDEDCDALNRLAFTFICANATTQYSKYFITQKFWDMARYGVIPFFEKDKYDCGNILDCPDICRVESPEHLHDAIKRLEADKDAHKKALRELYDMLKPEYFTNNYIKETFDEWLG